MGIISRRVLPLCGHLCVCCPGLRARSRQPVKRYKKLLADLFPKSQDEQPNDRKISKLTEYAVKNPFRIPKIAKSLELRGYKELRHEHYGSVRVIMRTFSKLFSACKDQMPLLAISALNMIHCLLEQQNDEMRILGCTTVVDFITQQVDMTYMHNLESFIPKFCSLARETGAEQRRDPLRAAGLEALSEMLRFMGEFSHMPADFDEIVAAALDNYEVVPETEASNGRESIQSLVLGLCKGTVAMRDALARFSFNMDSTREKHSRSLTKEESQMPKVWSQVCIQNMACFGKEATTIRRVLDSIFHYFDRKKSWSPDSGIALSVLRDMLFLLEKTGNDHLILGTLVRHLDHTNAANNLQLKTDIVRITTVLARYSKPKSTHTEVGIISDLSRHLRKSLQLSLENPDVDFLDECLQAIERCLIELARRIGEASPILDQMAVILEKLSSKHIVARTTIEAMAVLAHIVVSLPNNDLHKKVFPEALLYQLLRAMVHPDIETRIGCHHIFSVLLIPPSGSDAVLVKGDVKVLFRAPSSATAALFDKLMKDKQKSMENVGEDFRDAEQSWTKDPSSKEIEMTPARLTGYQASLVLSSLFVQATMNQNTPPIYEALGHTFSLTLLFSRPKTSSCSVSTRAFQLGLTLRTLSTDAKGPVKGSCQRRSLFTLSTAMLIVAATVYDVPDIIPSLKASITKETRDPFLEITEDNRIKLSPRTNREYGSENEEILAYSAMSQLSISPEASNENIVSMVVKHAPAHLEMNESQLEQKFTPDEALALGPKLHLDAFSSHMGLESMSFDEILPLTEEDLLSPTAGVPHLLVDVPVPPQPNGAMGVSQLIESALEAAGQVASITTPTSPVSYRALADQCEAFVAGTRRNMSIVMRLDVNPPNKPKSADEVAKGKWTQAVGARSRSSNESPVFSPRWVTPSPDDTWPLIRLPPASPYDNFLKAAGC